MTKSSQCVWYALVALIAAMAGAGRGMQAAPQSTDSVPTFTQDVAPILYANCVTCHRPGEIAPMSLVTYQEARPWARAITRKVAEGSMPPWHAEATAGTFSNERKLTAEREIDTRTLGSGWRPRRRPDGR